MTDTNPDRPGRSPAEGATAAARPGVGGATERNPAATVESSGPESSASRSAEPAGAPPAEAGTTAQSPADAAANVANSLKEIVEQTAAGVAQQAAAAQTVFEAAREAELTRAAASEADARQATVAAVSAEPLTPREALRNVRARRQLPPHLAKSLGFLAALDARTFLWINGLPRNDATNQFMLMLTTITNAGAAWIGVLAVMALANHSPEARRSFLTAAPTVFGTAWAIEGPIKGRVRRRRPFVTLAEALVIGRRPKNWSFPSGHTASAFAAATIVARQFPQSSLPLYGLAALVGFSRIYLGAHFPSDVVSGAVIGTLSGAFVPPLLRLAARTLFGRR